MAVLSEQAKSGPAADRHVCLVDGAPPETRRRIDRALADRELRLLLEVSTADDLLGQKVESSSIVVFPCDLDRGPDLALLRRLRRTLRGPAIVAISPPTTGTGVRRGLEAGADAVVFEPELESTLALAVRAVASGQSVVPRNVRASVERPALSHRERQVLSFVSSGFTNAQIAERLFLSESTIKSHLSSVFSKLGVRSRREAAALFRDLERTTQAKLELGAAGGAPA
jgi:DNA-binding NarL/FixJ family response regulator